MAPQEQSDAPLWERQAEESAKAFGAFSVYLDLQAEDRTVSAAYRQSTGRSGAKQAPSFWYDWSRAFRWTSRADARDAFIWKLDEDRRIAKALKDRAAVREARIGGYSRLLAVGSAKLDSFVDEEGNPLPDKLPQINAHAAARFIRDGARGLAEEFDELPTQRHELGGPNGQPIAIDHSKIDPKEAARIYLETIRASHEGEPEPKD